MHLHFFKSILATRGALMYNYDEFMANLERRNPAEGEFIQAVGGVVESIIDLVNDNPAYINAKILERITEPDRVVSFKVEWEDDDHNVQVNRGYRVQFNNTLGPYKGGLRFHSSVSLGSFKFLGFEQTFKNSLTTLPLGGAKGGSDFSPRGKSDNEIMRFCRAFMTQLQKYIGPETDIPAGDIGVGAKEIGYLYGQYKRIRDENAGVLTGKGHLWGGSLIRPEAAGYGAVYFAREMLKRYNDTLEGKRVAVSGFGNVAWGVVKKATELGAKVVTISGPDGYIYDEEGVSTQEKWNYMVQLRLSNNDIVAPYAQRFGAQFIPRKKPWEVPVDLAFPCAIQNELSLEDAQSLVANGVKYVLETSNMGCRREAENFFIAQKIPYGPGKAVNAGGVAVSGLEMAQNAMKLSWTAQEVDDKLQQIMQNIHKACLTHSPEEGGYVNYVKGANIAAFKRVADAMLELGY
jgi:glutamate dehydrogenase (NADP+)